MQAICSQTTNIGRTLGMEHVMMMGKVDAIKRLFTSSGVGKKPGEYCSSGLMKVLPQGCSSAQQYQRRSFSS
jgi:hypothetical protein